VSYAISKSSVGHIERFHRSTQHLYRALEINPKSEAIHNNALEQELLRATVEPLPDADFAIANVEWLLKKRSGDVRVLASAARLYGHLSALDSKYVDRCVELTRAALEMGAGITQDELVNSSAFLRLREDGRYDDLSSLAGTSVNHTAGGLLPVFLDPVEGESRE
jgi:hypothetical protein